MSGSDQAGLDTGNIGAAPAPAIPGLAGMMQDTGSILANSAQHFQLDLDQAPQAIAAFRQAAEQLRDLKVTADRLANIPAPGQDGVSINAVKEIGQWAAGNDPGSLRSALESGATELEKVAKALERSVQAHRNADEANAGQLRRQEL